MLHRLQSNLCRAISQNVFQSRSTVIVKRVHKPPLIEIPGLTPLETPQRILDEKVVHSDDDKWMTYEIEEKHQPHHKVKLILLRNVDDYGRKGQIIETIFNEAYKNLLLPKFAVYHTKENLDLYKDIVIPEGTDVYSSESVHKFISRYSKRVFDVCMSDSNSWTIEPWHIKASLRKHKVWCREEDLEIPGGVIEGPNMDLENKEFISVLTINEKERLKLRCRIHHIGPSEVINRRWYIQQAEPVWEKERQELLDMNRAPPNKTLKEATELKEHIEKFHEWKYEREQRIA